MLLVSAVPPQQLNCSIASAERWIGDKLECGYLTLVSCTLVDQNND